MNNQEFIEYLKRITTDNKGVLAELKKGLRTSTPWTNIALFPYIAKWTTEKTPWFHERALYTIATLYAFHPSDTASGNMGNTFSILKYKSAREDSSAVEKRFIHLLNTHSEDIPIVLRRNISILKSYNIPINWSQTLKDIQYWDHPDGFVQKQWAISFWSNEKTTTNKGENNE